MAKKKKKRRVSRKATPRMYGDGRPTQTAQAANRRGKPQSTVTGKQGGRPTSSMQPTIRQAGSSGAKLVALSEEYHYIPGDLRRLGILAVGTFAMLIVLGVIIH